jgi:HNH endonuclease
MANASSSPGRIDSLQIPVSNEMIGNMSTSEISTDLQYLRHDERQAQLVLESLYPDLDSREFVLGILASSIFTAHRISNASWSISLFPQFIRLNVGRGVVLSLHEQYIYLLVTGSRFHKLNDKTRDMFSLNHGRYAFIPDVLDGLLEQEDFTAYESLRDVHSDLIERAALNRRITFWPGAHSPSVLEVLRRSGYEVPDPDYGFAPEPYTELESEEPAETPTEEGERSVVLRQHIHRERSKRTEKIRVVLREHGCLECEVCGFDFYQRYGSIGDGFAEVHHKLPINTGSRLTRLSDLAVVCANCHRMLHRPRLPQEPLELSELRSRLQSSSTSNAL